MATRTEFAIPLFIALAAIYLVLPCLALVVSFYYWREEKRLEMADRAQAEQTEKWSASIELDILVHPPSPTVQPARAVPQQRKAKVLPLIWPNAEGKYVVPPTDFSNHQRAQTEVKRAQTSGESSSSLTRKSPEKNRKAKGQAAPTLEIPPSKPQPVPEKKQKSTDLGTVAERKVTLEAGPSRVQSQRAELEQAPPSRVDSVGTIPFVLRVEDTDLEPWPEVPKEWFLH